MFYNQYSDYSPEDIKTEKYEALYRKFLEMAKDDKVREQMKSIIYEGGFGDFSVNTDLTKNNIDIERRKRIAYSYILATYPETFNVMAQNKVNLFHGTNFNALPNILKYGMQSVDEQASKGIPTVSGEEWSRIGGKRNFISFTDDIETSLDYASFTLGENKDNQESFGVIIGISSDSLKQLKRCYVSSDMPEVGIRDSVPLEYIKTISVPEDKVKFVRKLVGDNEIIVTPIDTDEKFYYVDVEYGNIFFDEAKAKQLAEKKQTTKNEFCSEEMAEVSRTRKFSGIHGIYEKLKEIIKNKGRYNEEESRDK